VAMAMAVDLAMAMAVDLAMAMALDNHRYRGGIKRQKCRNYFKQWRTVWSVIM